jgi:hypothetical protein
MILFSDPRAELRDFLRAALADREEPFASGVTVSTKTLPVGVGSARPYVRVSVDARGRDLRLNAYASVRVQVWHSDEGHCAALADLCEALLLTARTATVRAVSPGTRLGPVEDPDTGEPLSALTVTVRLRPVALP